MSNRKTDTTEMSPYIRQLEPLTREKLKRATADECEDGWDPNDERLAERWNEEEKVIVITRMEVDRRGTFAGTPADQTRNKKVITDAQKFIEDLTVPDDKSLYGAALSKVAYIEQRVEKAKEQFYNKEHPVFAPLAYQLKVAKYAEKITKMLTEELHAPLSNAEAKQLQDWQEELEAWEFTHEDELLGPELSDARKKELDAESEFLQDEIDKYDPRVRAIEKHNDRASRLGV